MNFSLFGYDIVIKNWPASLIVLLIFLISRYVFYKAVKGRSRLKLEERKRLLVNFNSISTAIFIILEVVIWSNELQSMALSFMAIAVALVLATKELLNNLTGGFFRLFSGSFHIGDRIEVNGIRGDVIDRGPLSTTILEVGPTSKSHQYTGRSLVIPNSIFLSSVLKNESYLKSYVLHTFDIPLENNESWRSDFDLIKKIVRAHCEEYVAQAQGHMKNFELKMSVSSPDPKPRVHINIKSPSELEVMIRITVPADRKRIVEQRIIQEYLKEKYSTGA